MSDEHERGRGRAMRLYRETLTCHRCEAVLIPATLQMQRDDALEMLARVEASGEALHPALAADIRKLLERYQ